MGLVTMCTGRVAPTPFLIENMDIRVYSVEELCYCIGEYTFLVDSELMTDALVEWIRLECAIPELADMLKRLMENSNSFVLFFTRLLGYTGYYTPDEIDKISRVLDSNENISPLQRRKNVADYLASTGRYESALKQYQLLYYDCEDREDDAFKGVLLHNMGYVNSRLFRFREASWLFIKAYRLNNERASLEQYLAAVRLMYMSEDPKGILGKKKYMEFVASRGETVQDISLALERAMNRVEESLENSPEIVHLEEDLSLAGRDERAVLSVLKDEADRILSGYRLLIRD